MKQSIVHGILLVVGLASACKSLGNRQSVVSGLEPSDRAGELHQALIADLNKQFADTKNTVWFESSMQVQPDWLIESPANIWGRAEATLPKNLDCKAGEADCDEQFTRRLCQADSDCAPFNTSCQVLDATVSKPGQTAKKMCLGTGDQLLNRFYRTIVSTNKHLDITTLSVPTGRFYPMLVNALSYLTHKNPAPTIRILTAGKESKKLNALNQPQTIVNEMVAAMQKQGADLSKLRMDLAYLSSPSLSWNHSKIVIADTDRVIQGGHNLYDPDYLEDHSVFDASMEYSGPAALGTQAFVNTLWSHVSVNPLKNSGAPFGKYPYAGGFDVLKPASWKKMENPNLKPTSAGSHRVIGVGRLGYYGANPSDEAFKSMIRNAKQSIYIAQEDIFRKIPIKPVSDIQNFFNMNSSAALPTLVDAILSGKRVRIVQTDQAGDGLDGYGMMNAPEAQTYIVLALIKEAKARGMKAAEGKTLGQTVCEMFDIAPWHYFVGESKWGSSDRRIGSHPKIIIADEAVFYLGSHNFYPANLQEFGLVVTEEKITQQFLTNYWNKVWDNSAPHKISCSRADLETIPK